MDRENRLRAAAMVQLVSGLVNLFVVSWVSAFLWVTVGGTVSGVVMAICTLGLCPMPVGMLCGFAGIGIAIVAVFEVVGGAVGLAKPETAKTPMMVVAGIGILSVLLGSPIALITGIVVLTLLATDPGPDAGETDAEPPAPSAEV